MVFQIRSKVFWAFQVWMYMMEKVGVQPTCALSYFCLEFYLKCDHVECYEGGFFMLLLPFMPLFNYGKCIKLQPRWKWDFQWAKLCCLLSFLHFASCFSFCHQSQGVLCNGHLNLLYVYLLSWNDAWNDQSCSICWMGRRVGIIYNCLFYNEFLNLGFENTFVLVVGHVPLI